MQLLLIILLPGLGWTISYLLHNRQIITFTQPSVNKNRPLTFLRSPISWLIAGAAALPLVFSDPEELQLLLGMENGEILGWVFIAALISAALILMVYTLLWIQLQRLKKVRSASDDVHRIIQISGILQSALTLLIILVSVWIFLQHGQPGQYGEKMFVIMSDQADLSSISTVADPTERREAVYAILIEHANKSQESLRKTLDRIGCSYKPYYLVNAIQVPSNPILRLWLSSRKDVDRILDDPVLRPLPEELPERIGNDSAPRLPYGI